MQQKCPCTRDRMAAAAAAVMYLQHTVHFALTAWQSPQVFSNPRADYHITLTHLSHFQDARPEPLAADSGLDDAATPSEQRPGPSDWQLRREVAAAAALAAATPPFDLKVRVRRGCSWLLRRRSAFWPSLVSELTNLPTNLFSIQCHKYPSTTIHLQLERVVLARSGTLLLLWADPSGSVAALRGALLAAFPGAPPRQPATIHRFAGTKFDPEINDAWA